ncbi:MAG TPA: heavy metal-associated domain-containing protein [Pyrinomonadaceae bacterium]
MKSKQFVIAIVAFLMIAFAAVGASAVTKKATIRVDGMTCAKCTGSVEKALKATPGVEKVEVSLERKEAVVDYDDQKVTEAKLREVINATGFKVVEAKPDSQ